MVIRKVHRQSRQAELIRKIHGHKVDLVKLSGIDVSHTADFVALYLTE